MVTPEVELPDHLLDKLSAPSTWDKLSSSTNNSSPSSPHLQPLFLTQPIQSSSAFCELDLNSSQSQADTLMAHDEQNSVLEGLAKTRPPELLRASDFSPSFANQLNSLDSTSMASSPFSSAQISSRNHHSMGQQNISSLNKKHHSMDLVLGPAISHSNSSMSVGPSPPHALKTEMPSLEASSSHLLTSRSIRSASASPRLSSMSDKPKKKPIRRLGRNRVVCLQCYKSKTKCDGIRPCARCIRMGKQTSCVDRPYLRRGARPSPAKRRRIGDSPRPNLESPKQIQEVSQLDISSAVNTPPNCHVLSIEKDMRQVTRYQKLCKKVEKELLNGCIDLNCLDATKLSTHMHFNEAILIKRLRRYADGDQLQKMGFHNIDFNKNLKKEFRLSYSLASNEIEGLHHTNGGLPLESPVSTIHISLQGAIIEGDVKYTLFFNKAAERLFGFSQNETFQMFLYDSVPFLWRFIHPDDWKTKITFLLESCLKIKKETSCVVRIITKEESIVPCIATYKYQFNKEGLIENAYACFIPIPPSSYVPPPS